MAKTYTEKLLSGIDHEDGTIYNPKPHCIAPFKSITIDPTGEVFPDAVYQTPIGNLNTQSLKEIWYSDAWTQLRKDHMNFRQNAGCSYCHKKEKLIGHSRRRFFDTFFMYRIPKSQLEPVTDSTGHNLSLRPKVNDFENPDFLYLDINTSNKCNLKCVHCRGAVSTGWIPDEKKLQKSEIASLRSPRYGAYSMDERVIEKIFEYPEYFKNLRYVAFRGGEPTYEPKNKLILKKLIELGWNKQITIDISTNATVSDDEFFDLLNQFESTMLYISIEGVGPMYSYARGGKNFAIADLDNMIMKYSQLTNCEICITFTAMSSNVFNIAPTWNWMQQYGDYCNFSFTNTVSQPEYLSFSVLNDKMRERAFEMIKDIDEEIRWPGREIGRTYEPGINRLKEKLQEKADLNWQTHFQQFKDYTNTLDKIRNTNFLEVEPAFAEFWNE